MFKTENPVPLKNVMNCNTSDIFTNFISFSFSDITLFYSETSKLDDDLIRILSNCADELRRLVQILSALKDSPVSITDEGMWFKEWFIP